MEASPFLPEGEPQIPEIHIWQVFEEDEMFHHLFIDGRDAGRIDWEESPDGHVGYIDGLDAERELDAMGIRDIAWLPIAQCMKEQHPAVETIWHLDGTVVINEIKPSDFGLTDK